MPLFQGRSLIFSTKAMCELQVNVNLLVISLENEWTIGLLEFQSSRHQRHRRGESGPLLGVTRCNSAHSPQKLWVFPEWRAWFSNAFLKSLDFCSYKRKICFLHYCCSGGWMIYYQQIGPGPVRSDYFRKTCFASGLARKLLPTGTCIMSHGFLNLLTSFL